LFCTFNTQAKINNNSLSTDVDTSIDFGDKNVIIQGQTMQWHDIVLNINGPQTNEEANPNPFTYYRLNVTFKNGKKSLTVPGYFAADGNAQNTSAIKGNVWRVNFCPPSTGTWKYKISFLKGKNAAVSDNDDNLTPVENANGIRLDGLKGKIEVSPSDKVGKDFRAKGRLEYVGKRYLRFAGTGEYFLKAGSDSPENLFSYEDFDNTPNYKNYRKSYKAHIQDWLPSNPTWKNGKGKGLIGAINYLASQGANSISFIPMNIQGDDRNSFPYTSDKDFTRFDVSKLGQWEVVLSYAQEQGMFLHFKTQECENEKLLDGGDTGLERKLYYRELVARFGHHLALNWNLGEENGAKFRDQKTQQTDAQRIAEAAYMSKIDPYHNHIVLHTAPYDFDRIYTPLLGDKSALTGLSIQVDFKGVHKVTKEWIKKSTEAGRPWVVANDEQNSAKIGIPDDAYKGSPTRADIRKSVLWGNLLAGGFGVEYYFGYSLPQSDMTCQDFSYRSTAWSDAKNAIDFMNRYIPFWEMDSHDELVSDISVPTAKDSINSCLYCFAKPQSVYTIYIPENTSRIKVKLASGEYRVDWYNPHMGGPLKSVFPDIKIQGSKNIAIKGITFTSPDSTKDWVLLIRNVNLHHEGNGTASDNVLFLPTSHPFHSNVKKAVVPDIPNPTDVVSTGTFEEKDGYVIIEAESSIDYAKKGFKLIKGMDASGDGYLEYMGPDRMKFADPAHMLVYRVQINNPGIYNFKWRNVRQPKAKTNDAGNDSWLRIGGHFYCSKNGKKYDLNENFIKMWNQRNEFSYECKGEAHIQGKKINGVNISTEFKTPGLYYIEFGGRSAGHCVDKLVLYKDSAKDIATNNMTPESSKK